VDLAGPEVLHLGQGVEGRQVGTRCAALEDDVEEVAARDADDADQPLSSTAISIEASTRGTTRRWIALMPSTSIASISSRILRAPRSAQIAVPGAGDQQGGHDGARLPQDGEDGGRTGERLRAELAGEGSQLQRDDRAEGMATSAVGMIVTLAMNQACWRNSRSWNGRLNSDFSTSRANAKRFPLAASGRVGENLPSNSPGAVGLSVAVTRRPPAGEASR
jgi:hypothetical protein